jgi:hypothetical protein
MKQPECFIAYAPQGGGLLCAVTYVADGKDISGWFVGLKDYAYPSAYFRIENFFSVGDKRFFATDGSDIYGGWRFDYAKSHPELDPPVAVDDALCHRLDMLEDAFAGEWLVFEDDERFAAEETAYAADDIATGGVLVHHAKLTKFDREKPVWTFYSHGFNDEVLNYMAPRWPLDYGAEQN